MQCPIDSETLVIADRQGIEIDYCPKCRGVWLDRGELDKIIERASRDLDRTRDRDDDRGRSRRDWDDDDDDRRGLFGGKKRKKESFLSELFEFGG